jgi:AraC-like DNA-binding protein/quercetin dioxygenase-like cupin family protein
LDYINTTLKEEIVLKKIVTIHYFEYTKDYVFTGESHNFWELVYVDKGEIEVMADTIGYKLKQGEMIFHKPNEFHNVWANGTIAPNLVIISFECKSSAMKFFEEKILQVGDFEKNIMAEIINEAKNAYSSPLDDTFLIKLEKKKNPIFGCEQLIKINLERMLIMLVRKGKSIKNFTKVSTVTKQRSDSEIVNNIINYLEDNIYSNIKFTDVCKFTHQSGTNLKVTFKSIVGIGIMEYYRRLKIEEIKRIIREKPLNFTEIAEKLGYTSVHYFSRHFKQATGMTPTEYATSVKVKID